MAQFFYMQHFKNIQYGALGCVSNSTNSCIAILLHTSVFSGSFEILKYLYYSTDNCMLTWGGGGGDWGGLLLLDGNVDITLLSIFIHI